MSWSWKKSRVVKDVNLYVSAMMMGETMSHEQRRAATDASKIDRSGSETMKA